MANSYLKVSIIPKTGDLCCHDMRRVIRKSVVGVYDQIRHKPGCTATKDGYRLQLRV